MSFFPNFGWKHVLLSTALTGMLSTAALADPPVKGSALQPGTIIEVNPVTGEYHLMQVLPNGEKKLIKTFSRGMPLMAKPVTPAMADYLQAVNSAAPGPRCLIGVELNEIPQGLHRRLGIDEDSGLLVRDLLDGGPAAEAGVQKYDLLLKINGKPVKLPGDVVRVVNETKTEPITLTLLREKEPFELKVTPMEARKELSGTDAAGVEAPGVPPELQVVGPGMIVPSTGQHELETLHADIAALQEQVKKLCDQVQHLEEKLDKN